ncbi:MAG: hypothetical protein Q8J71_04320, partial [Brevundimonas sp.]|nr:hypothetical protein [Brevundimonas sp.]
MSNAFAPRPFEEFEDEFDLEAGYAAPGTVASAHAEPAPFAGEETVDQRPALQFTAPTVPAAAEQPVPYPNAAQPPA